MCRAYYFILKPILVLVVVSTLAGSHHPIGDPTNRWLLFFGDREDGTALYAASAPDFQPIVVEVGFLLFDYNYGPVLVTP